jgi:hypothetical protein
MLLEANRQKSFIMKLRDYLVELYLDLLTDFTAEPDHISSADLELEQLAIKQ